MTAVRRGRLLDPDDAPAVGERVEEVARVDGVIVAQIVSGTLARPVAYDQAYDEWAVVLSGGATLTVHDQQIRLEPGEWVLLPAGVPHTLEQTRPGTSWLVVHRPG